MATVTVPGTGSSTITELFNNQFNLKLAQDISNALAAAAAGGTLTVTSATAGSVPAIPVNPGGINELLITAGGSYKIPAGDATHPDYVVILDSAAAVTINGSPNTSIWGGIGPTTIIDPAIITIAEGAGDATATVSGSGDVLAANNHNDTLTGTGSGETLFGGGGSSTFLFGSSANNDVAVGSDGTLSVRDAGTSDTIFGGVGTLNVTTSGSGSKIMAGIGTANVSLGGSGGEVVGSLSSLFVTDSGTSDTIHAGSGFTSVNAPSGGSVLFGGAGIFDFIGGTAPSTVIGSSGNGTVIGGAGNTTILGGAGGAITFIDSIAGAGAFYIAGNGNDTIDASFSKGPNTLYGSFFDSTSHNALIGGTGIDYINAGSGADTLVGGGGANQFSFWTQFGGIASTHVISDFSAIDGVFLMNYGAGAADAALATAATSNGSTTITLSDNTKITFTGVTNAGALQGHIFS